MPLTPYARGQIWWVKGRIDYEGRPITGYYRCSTGASSEQGARDWIATETDRQRRRHLVGDENALTFADAVMLYPAKPAEARYLIPITREIGHLFIASITPKMVRALGAQLYPTASTDTWQRQVVTPTKAVINNAHDDGLCPPIRIKGYSTKERVDQDTARNRHSRPEKQPVTRAWISSFEKSADAYNRALVWFLFETGARIDQAISLEPKHLDLMSARVWLKSQKGHPAQWVAISQATVVRLANLPPRRPHNRKQGYFLPKRVFGYATRGGVASAWRSICKDAEIPYLSPHAARHGFYTDLRVVQGIDPITAAKAGRWSDPSLPDKIYAHSDTDEHEIRNSFGTNPVQTDIEKTRKNQKTNRK